MGNPRNGLSSRATLELGICLIALGVGSKQESQGSKDFYLAQWRNLVLQSLIVGAKNIPGVRKEEETCCPFLSLLQIGVFALQVISEIYIYIYMVLIGAGTNE